MRKIFLALTALLVVSAVSAQESLTAKQQKGKEYFDKAQVAFDKRDYKNTFKYDKKSAELGYDEGCYCLGICYFEAYGTEKDYNKAIKWFKKAVDLGYDKRLAYNYIGNSYYRLKNYQEATRYHRLGLEAGNAWAGWNLGKAYFDGLGVQKNEAEAARLFARAVLCDFDGEEVCKHIVNNDKKYFKYNFYKRYADAAFAYDYALLKVNPNLQRPYEHLLEHKTPAAVNMVKAVADKGNRWAQFKIADLQWSGEIPNAMPQDRDAAIAFWEKNSNDKEARKKLVSASMEGFYRKPIPQQWLDEDRELFSIMNNNNALRKGVENGNRQSAEAFDKYILCRDDEADKLLLLDNAAKTGYDKYAEDVKRINSMYQRVVDFTNAGIEKTFSLDYVDRTFPTVSVDFYTKHPKYDKQGVVKKAQLLKDFMLVNSALNNMGEEPSAWAIESKFFGLLTTSPKWYTERVKYWFDEVNNAIAICNNYSSGATLNSYFKKSLPKLKEKKANGIVSVEKQREEYEAEVNKENRRFANVQEMTDIEEGRRAYPKPKVVNSSDNSQTIEFADGTKGTLFHDSDGWYVDPGIGFNRYYKSYGQAEKALYLYKKYNHKSYDGLK